MARRAAKVDDNQAEVVAYLRAQGCHVEDCSRPPRRLPGPLVRPGGKKPGRAQPAHGLRIPGRKTGARKRDSEQARLRADGAATFGFFGCLAYLKASNASLAAAFARCDYYSIYAAAHDVQTALNALEYFNTGFVPTTQQLISSKRFALEAREVNS